MTKNEMVDIMYKYIDKIGWVEPCSYYDDYYSIDTYDVEKLLDVMIEAGMLPPEIENPDRKKCVRESFYINEWESEDGSN
jgi:hypothetical protein